MKSPRIVFLSALTAITCLTSSCVTVTTYKKEPRQNVRFTSLKAAQTFYDGYLSHSEPKGGGTLDVLIVAIPYRKVVASAESVRFNAAVREADTNHNGIITEAEANAYKAKPRE